MRHPHDCGRPLGFHSLLGLDIVAGVDVIPTVESLQSGRGYGVVYRDR
jgi:hypothetical protein